MSINGPRTLEEARLSTFLDCSEFPSMTVQADAKEADINKIIARFEKAGMVTRLNDRQPYYGDVSELTGLQEAIMKVQQADELFMSLSAQIRERFENDPVQLVDFLNDEGNRKEAEDLGIVIPPPKDESAELTTPSSPADEG